MRIVLSTSIIVLTLLCSCVNNPGEEYICDPRIGIYNNSKASFFYEIVKDSSSFTGHLEKVEGGSYRTNPVEFGNVYYVRIYRIAENGYTLDGNVVSESTIVAEPFDFYFTATKALNYIQVYNDKVILVQENSSNDKNVIRTTID